MRILLTNDDGIHAPGLRALYPQLRQLGEVTVIAPMHEQSAAGHSVTLHSPLIVQESFDETGVSIGYAVEGRPADCVKLALLELLPQRPDLIVSGINAGSNAGINVLYSGTVAAAIEGAFFRCTSIAVSLDYENKPIPFIQASDYARQVIEQIIAYASPREDHFGGLWNVNIPDLDKSKIRGIRLSPQNVSPYIEKFMRRTDPRGRTYFWMGNDFACPEPHPDTDESLLAEGFITITPLQFDLTNHRTLNQLHENSRWKIS